MNETDVKMEIRRRSGVNGTDRACVSWKPLCVSIDDDMPGKSVVSSWSRKKSASVRSAENFPGSVP